MKNQGLTCLTSLAKELGMDNSNLRKYVLKKGINYSMARDPINRQMSMSFAPKDADILRFTRTKEGFSKINAPVCINGDVGAFYAVQLIPEFAPNRLKLGFSNDTMGRLSTHRCSSPTAIMLKSWDCKRSWERAAMDSATRQDCILIANEVYDCDSLENVLGRLDTFFSIMPAVRKHRSTRSAVRIPYEKSGRVFSS